MKKKTLFGFLLMLSMVSALTMIPAGQAVAADASFDIVPAETVDLRFHLSPPGTKAITQYNYLNGSYILDVGDGTIVTITGNGREGTWSSTTPIACITMKAGPAFSFTGFFPPATSGTFNNQGFPPIWFGIQPDIQQICFHRLLTTDIAVDPTSLDFGSVYSGYAQPAAQTVTVSNTGELPVTVDLPTSTDFDISAQSGFSDGKAALFINDASASFTVQPKAGLDLGTHNETIVVSDACGNQMEVVVAFTVLPAPPVRYQLTFIVNGGSAILPLSLDVNSIVDLAAYSPTRAGFHFNGWYSDEALTQKITSVQLTRDTTIYAGWVEANDTNPGEGQGDPGDTPKSGNDSTVKSIPDTGDGESGPITASVLFLSLAGFAALIMAARRRTKEQ